MIAKVQKTTFSKVQNLVIFFSPPLFSWKHIQKLANITNNGFHYIEVTG